MTQPTPLIMVCANLAWNLVNFRADLIQALLDDGFRVMAIAPANSAMATSLRAMGCEFAAVKMNAAGLSPLRDLATALAFFRLIRHHRPSAWLSWTIKPNIYGSLAAACFRVPALPNVSGLGTAFIRRSAITNLVELLYRLGFRRAPSVFFQNGDDRDLFVSLGLVKPLQARLLPGSGVDWRHFSAPTPDRPTPRHFLMVARIVADKGVREYVAAARQLRRRWPDARFRLLGFLDADNRTVISRDEVMGWVDEGIIEFLPGAEDVRPAMAEADFVVLPSYREGLSRVLLEAAAMSRPIVTTNVPGCRDIVSDGVNGYLCAARDAESLASAMIRAGETDDTEWQRLARAGRARIIAEFSHSRVIELYRQALADAGVAPSGNGNS